jgi:hypothetical protein
VSVYAKVLAALKALPEGDRRLARFGFYSAQELCCCAVGVAIDAKTNRGWSKRDPVLAALGDGNMDHPSILRIYEENDTFEGHIEDRYDHMVNWLEKQVAAEVST